MKKLLSLIFLLITITIRAQIYPPAVEVWSEPIRVDSLSERLVGEGSPTLPDNQIKLFLMKATKISIASKIDTLWSYPIALNNNINNGSPVRHPSINRRGDRLYFCRWGGYGGWDLWYSKWDSTLNDWGPSINLGPNINSPNTEYYAYELSEDTLYCINQVWADLGVCIYVKDSLTNEWQIVDSSNYYHPFGEGAIRGLSITGDRRKAYFSQYVTLNSDSLQSELYVTFWDSLENHWGEVFELNINSNAYQPDTTNNFYWIGGWDEDPWISEDGKLLFFHSNRDAAREDTTVAADIYMSIQLIDENGNPVSVDDLPDLSSIINNFLLLQNYPNPFNSVTKIRFYITRSDKVSLTIYDVLGNEIFKAIDNKSYSPGWHEYQLNMETRGKHKTEISSGVYIYKITTQGESLSKKLLYIK